MRSGVLVKLRGCRQLPGRALLWADTKRSRPIRLHDDEEIIKVVKLSSWWTSPRYVITLGFWEIWRRRHRFVLTNQRVVLTKGVINKTERSAPLGRIQDAQLHRSPFTGGRVILTTAGGSLGIESIRPLTRADAVALTDALTPVLGHPIAQPV